MSSDPVGLCEALLTFGALVGVTVELCRRYRKRYRLTGTVKGHYATRLNAAWSRLLCRVTRKPFGYMCRLHNCSVEFHGE